MQAWDVVVVGASVAALRGAIAAADAGATVTVLSSSSPSSFADDATTSGLATSSGETDPSTHAADTHRVGADLCENDIVASTTSSAVDHLSQLEKWGLNLRRDRNGAPHLGQLPGQSNPRTASTGDSTLREVRSILEEQCMKRNIPRRGDIEILDVVFNASPLQGGHISGLIALDIQSGEIFGIQAKSILIADSGFQSAWRGDSTAMAPSASLLHSKGIPLVDLEFTSSHPLVVADTNLCLPLDLLGSGGVVNGPDGQPMSTDEGPDALAHAILSAGSASLDLTEISRPDSPWFAGVAEALSSRCGIDYTLESIPLMPIVTTTIGGIPTGVSGNVVCGGWDDTIPGLFAAGDAACSGMHGAAMNSGDQLLTSLVSGATSGGSAAQHAVATKHTGSSAIAISLSEAHHMHDSILVDADSEGETLGEIQTRLATTMRANMGHERSAAGLSNAKTTILELGETKIIISDKSRVMNTELVTMLRTKRLLTVALSAVVAASARKESRGTHVRTDHPDTDSGQANHSAVVGTSYQALPLRS